MRAPTSQNSPMTLNVRWRILAAIVIVAVRLARWRVIVRGVGHLPPRGGAVLAFNHHSYVDFIMLTWPAVRVLHRPVRFLAKREIWSSRKVGWVVRWAGAVPVDRESAAGRAGAFDAAITSLAAGDLVAVAPEQTISPSFELLPFRSGAVRMAQEAGVPIVPVIGWGSQRFVTKGAGLGQLTRLPVTVRFGEPVRVAPDDDPRVVTERLQHTMQVLLEQEQRAYPDGCPAGAPWVPARLGGGAPPHEEVLAEHRRRLDDWQQPTTGDELDAPSQASSASPASDTNGEADDGPAGAAAAS